MIAQKKILAAAMIVLQLAAATGCATNQATRKVVAPINMQKIQAEVKVGDRVRVHTTAIREIRMDVVDVDETKLTGVKLLGGPVELTYDRINSIEVLDSPLTLSREATVVVFGLCIVVAAAAVLLLPHYALLMP